MFRLRTLFVCILFFVIVAASAYGATVEVGNCSTYPQYPTITAAIAGAPAGTLIYVCPGTYPEQITINKNLTLQGFKVTTGAGAAASVLTPPAGGLVPNATSLTSSNPIAAQILVQSPATSVTFNNIVVDGTGNGITGCGPDLIGIYFQNASGVVTRSAVLNEKLGTGLEGCQSGSGIYVQSGGGGTSAVNVNFTVVQNYQKNGITGNEIGTTLTASNNTVVGQGSTTGAAENGIQVGFGATGNLSSNTVADNIWALDTISDPGDAAAGILVYASKNVQITSNQVTNSQYGIVTVSDAIYGVADSTIISSNRVNATHIFDAIDVCSNSNTVSGNTVNGADESGIHLDDTCGGTGKNNSVMNNTVSVACAGVLLGNGTGNTLGGNFFYDVTIQRPTGNSCTPVSPLAARPLQATATGGSGISARVKPLR